MAFHSSYTHTSNDDELIGMKIVLFTRVFIEQVNRFRDCHAYVSIDFHVLTAN